MQIREKTIPVLRPFGGKEESEALLEVFESGWWGKGPKVEEFEERFAKLTGARYALAVTSNTHGQDLLYKAWGINSVEVISPTISFITTGIVPVWNNCKSLLCDIDKRTLNILPDDVRKRLSSKVGAICVVNMAGIPADIGAIRDFYKGLLIEDAAHSCYTPGVGEKSDAVVWSFQAVKTLPAGDGGMITTNDYALYKKLKSLTWLGISSTYERTGKFGYSWDYEVDIVGYKAYMTDIIAALCLVQLEKLDTHLAIRRHIQKRYMEELDGYLDAPAFSDTVQYYCARVKNPNHRDILIDYLAGVKIHTSVHFKPLHLHPVLRQQWDFPNADFEWKKLITLPCHPALTDEDVDYIVYWIKRFFDTEAYNVVCV